MAGSEMGGAKSGRVQDVKESGVRYQQTEPTYVSKVAFGEEPRDNGYQRAVSEIGLDAGRSGGINGAGLLLHSLLRTERTPERIRLMRDTRDTTKKLRTVARRSGISRRTGKG